MTTRTDTTRPLDGDALLRATMVGGAFWLAWRVLQGLGGFLWTVFGLAVAAKFTGFW